MGLTLEEARELLASPLWEPVRDRFLAGQPFEVYPAGDLRRLEYVEPARREEIGRWCEAAARLGEWKLVVAGPAVRELREKHPEVYPAIFRYEAYFAKCADADERLRMVLKLKFPDVLEMIDK